MGTCGYLTHNFIKAYYYKNNNKLFIKFANLSILSKNSEKPPFGALAIIPPTPPGGVENSPLKSFHRFTIYLVPPSKMAQKGGFLGFLAPPPVPRSDPKNRLFYQNFAVFYENIFIF